MSLTHVAIGVITFMRPSGLSRLLESLSELKLPRESGLAVELIVVDNDPCGSAQSVVKSKRQSLPWPITYEIESKRGIPSARNRVVSIASHCDYLLFVDDDEYVDPNWLIELMSTQQRFDADVVAGPQIAQLPDDVPQWIARGGFFRRSIPPSGTRLAFTGASTGNVLIKLSVLRDFTKPFDERMALTGATDSLLFLRLLNSGATVVSCDEAIVYETIPRSRASFGWLVRRAYRGGNSVVICERVARFSTRMQFLRLIKGGTWMLVGLGGLPLSLVVGRAHFVRMLLHISKGAGMITGLLGHQYEEYREIHGS